MLLPESLGFAFLCKLGLLKFEPHWDYQFKYERKTDWRLSGLSSKKTSSWPIVSLWTASDNVCACVRLTGKDFSVDGMSYFLNGWKLIWSTFKGDFNCNPQQTCITDWILWLSYVEFSCMVEGPFSRLIFLSLAPLMKQIKRSRSRLLWDIVVFTFDAI